MFVLVTTDSGSTRGEPPIDRYNKFMSDFILRGGSAHAVLIQGSQTGVISDIIGNLVANTNGVLETMNISNVLADKMKALAARLSADRAAMKGRYEVEYRTEAKGVAGEVEVSVARHDIRLRVSARRPF